MQRSRDGHLVLMHDKRVDRTTGGAGRVGALTLAELRRLDAGSGERIPTVEELLGLARGRVGLMLEIITPGIAGQLCATVAASGFAGPLIYASFLHEELLSVRRAAPEAATLALIEGVPVTGAAFAREARASHVGLALDSLTGRFVETLHEAGLAVFVYTVNDPRDVEWVRSLGVDGIISDFPERLPAL